MTVIHLSLLKAVRLVAGFPSQWTGFDPRGICGGQSVIGAGFIRVLRFPCQFSFHRLLHRHHHLSSGSGKTGQIVADVPTGLGLTANQKMKKKTFEPNQCAFFFVELCEWKKWTSDTTDRYWPCNIGIAFRTDRTQSPFVCCLHQKFKIKSTQ
jgi:hypothetical protein